MAGFEPLFVFTILISAVVGAIVGRFVSMHTRGKRTKKFYWLAELALALIFSVTVWEYGVSVQGVAYCAFAALLLSIFIVDIESMIIPNGFLLAGIAIWIISVCFIEISAHRFGIGSLFVPLCGSGVLAVIVDGFAGAFVVGGGVALFSWLFEKITGRYSLGGGDIKLLFVVGLYLGLAVSLLNLFLSCIVGLLFSFIWSRHKNTSVEKTRVFPFGPAIAVSTVLNMLSGFSSVANYL